MGKGVVMYCEKCGHKLDEDAIFCAECGISVSNESEKKILYCEKCGKKLEEDAIFCTGCGYSSSEEIKKNKENVIEVETKQEGIKETLAPLEPKRNVIKENVQKIIDFILKHKKPFMIGSCTCLMTIIGIVLFFQFYDFSKIRWNEEGDYFVTHTKPMTLNLSVTAYEKDEVPITDIVFEADKGEIKSDGVNVTWALPNEKGKYTITAHTPSGKKIKKSVTVVDLEDEEEEERKVLAGVIKEEEKTTDDNDLDGLTNEEEEKLSTDKNSTDTDSDGLSDYYEVNVSKTDPLKKDTDGDGITDGNELDLGLDPLKKDSKGDGIADNERILNYTISDQKVGVTVQITGKGNIANTTIDFLKNSTFSTTDGLLDHVYNFYTNGEIDSAIVTMKYDIQEVQAKGLNEDNLTLYYFNEETKELEALPTTVDKNKKEITVTLKHFSKYVIGDSNIVLTNKDVQILFVIDNSVSMYTEKQLNDAGYTEVTGADGNDTDFKRLTLTNNMIDMFTGNYEFGVAEFASNYAQLKGFSKEKEEVKDSVNGMKNKWQVTLNGTNIITALNKGIGKFSKDDKGKYLILLTDGENTVGSLKSEKAKIIEAAKEKDVKVCIIGLGDEVEKDDLTEIATSTGCSFYNASSSSALDEIYSLVGADINYDYVDTNGDNQVDGMIVADSGFLVKRDGFSFSNFNSNKSSNGHCYGMAAFAMLYYTNKLPMTMNAHDVTSIKLTGIDKWHSEGYNLAGTYFETNKPLYDFKITTEGLKYPLFDLPDDYRDRVEDRVWMIKKEYYEQLESIGATFTLKKKKSEDYDQYQSATLNIDNSTFNNAVTKDESSLFSAIWRLFIFQAKEDQKYDFGADPDKSFELLKENLENGIPVMLNIDGSHAINAIRLIQDMEDANKFKIEVYDNNYSGETRYIEVTRTKFNKIQLNFTAWTNEYKYDFIYDKDNKPETDNKIGLGLLFPKINE